VWLFALVLISGFQSVIYPDDFGPYAVAFKGSTFKIYTKVFNAVVRILLHGLFRQVLGCEAARMLQDRQIFSLWPSCRNKKTVERNLEKLRV